MVKYAMHWGQAVVGMGVAGLLIGTCLLGCGRSKPDAQLSESGASKVNQANSAAEVKPLTQVDPRLSQPFAEATLADPPQESDEKLTNVTLTGKSVGKLYSEVVRSWDDIRFVAADGKRLTYRATIDTELGTVEIHLQPDLAPNHVRNFVALARAGYYDGLVFERIIQDQSDTDPKQKVEVVEAGCPLGTGELGFGSIGYWLKPELNDKVHHEEGTLGACHGEDPNTAACKFYITLCPTPLLDGNYTVFGKVTRGLDVVRKIFTQPIRNSAEDPGGDRPEKPIVIRKVTISTEEETLHANAATR